MWSKQSPKSITLKSMPCIRSFLLLFMTSGMLLGGRSLKKISMQRDTVWYVLAIYVFFSFIFFWHMNTPLRSSSITSDSSLHHVRKANIPLLFDKSICCISKVVLRLILITDWNMKCVYFDDVYLPCGSSMWPVWLSNTPKWENQDLHRPAQPPLCTAIPLFNTWLTTIRQNNRMSIFWNCL